MSIKTSFIFYFIFIFLKKENYVSLQNKIKKIIKSGFPVKSSEQV